MKKILYPALACLLLATACKKKEEAPATMQFSAALSGTNEVPAVTTSATGNVEGTYDPSTKVLTYTVTYSGLTPTAGHFHMAAAGANGPVAVTFTDVSKSPFTGTYTLTQAQADALLAGNFYANLHTRTNTGGEIRANVLPK